MYCCLCYDIEELGTWQNVEPGEVTLEKAMKLLSGKNVRQCGRPKRIQPTVDTEEEEVAAEAT